MYYQDYCLDEEKPPKSEDEIAVRDYLSKRQILELFHLLMSLLLSEQPEHPYLSVIDWLDQLIQFREGMLDTPPMLFSPDHVRGIFQAMDPVDKGVISAQQLRNGMFTVGLTGLDCLESMTSLINEKFVSREFAEEQTNRRLLEQIRTLVTPERRDSIMSIEGAGEEQTPPLQSPKKSLPLSISSSSSRSSIRSRGTLRSPSEAEGVVEGGPSEATVEEDTDLRAAESGEGEDEVAAVAVDTAIDQVPQPTAKEASGDEEMGGEGVAVEGEVLPSEQVGVATLQDERSSSSVIPSGLKQEGPAVHFESAGVIAEERIGEEPIFPKRASGSSSQEQGEGTVVGFVDAGVKPEGESGERVRDVSTHERGVSFKKQGEAEGGEVGAATSENDPQMSLHSEKGLEEETEDGGPGVYVEELAGEGKASSPPPPEADVPAAEADDERGREGKGDASAGTEEGNEGVATPGDGEHVASLPQEGNGEAEGTAGGLGDKREEEGLGVEGGADTEVTTAD